MKTLNHGRHSFYGKNLLCSMHSYDVESIGRFGRIFRELPPVYHKPNILREIGKKGGPMDGGNTDDKTNTVALGFIFLGQFIDHDITFDTRSNFMTINNPETIENSRTPTLDLDCIFGGGPENNPYLYTPPREGNYLLTGKLNNNIGQGVALESEDLARNGKGTALIGDPRNDENRVISQLQLSFIRFYNKRYDELIAEHNSHSTLPVDHHEIYVQARRDITWHYQWVVLNEFLPALCGAHITNRILHEGRKFYKPVQHPFIPVEFSVAAYRFGHSMIAQLMHVQPGQNDASIFSGEFGRGFAPIKNAKEVVDWSVFFDFGQAFQKANKLNTKMASDLLELPFFTNPTDEKSLATRNLRRGQSFLLPSGEQVAECLDVNESFRTATENHINNISGGTLNKFTGTPLWLYILAESEVVGRIESESAHSPGEGLGPVGATIVAETIIGLMELDTESFLGSNRDWQPHLGSNGEFTMKDFLSYASS